MRRFTSLARNSGLYVGLSIFMAFLMVVTLLPHEILAQSLPNRQDIQAPWLEEGQDEPVTPAPTPETDPPESQLPVVITDPTAIEITSTSAIIQGQLTELGSAEAVQVCFEYGEDDSFGLSTDIIEMKTAGKFSFNLLNLKPETTYNFRAKAEADSNVVYGEICSFTTLTEEPENPAPIPVPDQEPAPAPEVTPTPIPTPEPPPEDIPAPTPPPTPAPEEDDIASLEKVVVPVTPDKDSEIKSRDGKIQLNIPKEAISESLDMELTENNPFNSTGAMVIKAFEMKAYNSNTKEKVSRFKQNLQITIQNEESDLDGLDPDSLCLYYLDDESGGWIPLADSRYDKSAKILTATTDHFTYFGEMANPIASGPGRVMAAQVNISSGAAIFSYPVDLPPGPGGFKPRLELNYNSASVDEMKNKRDVASWVGLGWSLNLPRISYDLSSKEYYLELYGASYKLISTNGVDYHTNPEQYFKVVHTVTPTTNKWETWDKEGVYYRFGENTDQSNTYPILPITAGTLIFSKI
jgi:hypothetical protein